MVFPPPAGMPFSVKLAGQLVPGPAVEPVVVKLKIPDCGVAFLMMVVRFMRAHEESAVKAQRLRAAYDHKRKQLADRVTSKPFTRRLPAWLRWHEDKSRFVLVKDRAKLLLEIFRKADAGWGKHRIARWLNERGEEVSRERARGDRVDLAGRVVDDFLTRRVGLGNRVLA